MLELKEISYAYPAAEDAERLCVLAGASLSLSPGEVLALVGPNGAGKSTLARIACGSLAPGGGEILLDGMAATSDILRHVVGFVRQDPESQLVAPTVFDEVAFGPCNLGLSQDEVRARVAEALDACGLAGFEGRLVSELSGGELQRVAIAGVVAMRPRYLVLDEVTSQLDGGSRERVRAIVRSLASEGVGVLMVTHDLEEIAAASHVAVMDGGKLRWEGSPAALFSDVRLRQSSGLLGSRLEEALACLVQAGYDLADGVEPAGMVAFARQQGIEHELLELLSRRYEPSFDMSFALHEGAEVDSVGKGASFLGTDAPSVVFSPGDAVRSQPMARERGSLALAGVTVRYDERCALDDVSIEVAPGSITLVAGPSGSGKSTAAAVASGLIEPEEGSATVGKTNVRPGRVGLCLQRAEDQLFCDTVLDDVAFGPSNFGASVKEAHERAERALGRMGLDEGLWSRSPFALSGGQRRRAALAGIMAMEPEAYVLDEPTVGLDAAARGFLHGLVRELARAGSPVLVVSHDLGEWLDVVDGAVLVVEGRVCWRGSAEELVRNPSPLVESSVVPPLWLRLREALVAGGAS